LILFNCVQDTLPTNKKIYQVNLLKQYKQV